MSLRLDISADEALQRLIDGNERFLRGEARETGLPRETVARLAHGQQPFVTILGCSDSRVAPELIFDAGLGELFVIRVAGNVLSAEVAGSMQYAVAHLQTPLLVVLGHEGCGAIQAALETKYQNVQQRSRIQLLWTASCPSLMDWTPGRRRRSSWRGRSKPTSARRCAGFSSRPKAGRAQPKAA